MKNTNNFKLFYHLVLVTKYRHKVISYSIEKDLKGYAEKFFTNNNAKILEIEANEDHLHIIFSATPNIFIPNFVGSFKANSSKIIKKKHVKFLKEYYWKSVFWSSGYFICTVGENTVDTVKKYIQNQKAAIHPTP